MNSSVNGRSDPDSVRTDDCSSSGRLNAPQHQQSVISRRESEAQFNGEGKFRILLTVPKNAQTTIRSIENGRFNGLHEKGR
jgi:hypothetical protein